MCANSESMGLRSWLRRLSAEGLLLEVRERVSASYEVSEFCMQHDGVPLLFHAVDGEHRVAMNVLGSRELLSKLFGVPKEQLAAFLAGIPTDGLQSSVRVVEDSETKAFAREPDLRELPILRHFKSDGGAYITAGVVVAELDGVSNASFHRMLVLDERRLAVRLVPSRHLYNMYREARERSEELRVGVAIGVDPFLLLAAATRVPRGKEFEYAAALKRAAGLEGEVELFRLRNGVAVPHAEFVLEGFFGGDAAKEGPFVDITGTYDVVREEPVLTLTRIYHRKDPIYHAILPSGGEHRLLMGVPYEPLIFKAVGRVTRVKNVVLTDGGCCYLHAVIQIRKGGEGEAKNACVAAFAAHPSLKLAVVVDEDVNIYDVRDVEYAVATRVRWDRDVVLIPNVRGSSLDPSSENGLTTKVGIDATKKGDARKYERVGANIQHANTQHANTQDANNNAIAHKRRWTKLNFISKD